MSRALLTAAMVLVAMPAAALEPVVGGYVGTLILGPDHELYAPEHGKHLDQPVTVSIGARAGLSLTEWFDVEGELEVGAWPVQGGTATIAGMRIGPRLIAPNLLGQGRDVHLTAGVGNLAVLAPNSLTGKDVDFAAHIGPGVAFDIGQRVSLRGDYRVLVTSHEGESRTPSLQSLITVGAAVRLGARRDEAADVPPPPVAAVVPAPPVVVAPPPVVVAPPPVVAPMEEVHEELAVVADKILFASGSSELAPESLAHIEQLAAILIDNPQLTEIRIEGHTDSSGSADSNLRLSQSRVDEVARLLVTHGLDADRVVAEGFGESRPVADNSTPQGRAVNRRVEIRAE